MHRSDTTPLLDVSVYGIQTQIPSLEKGKLDEIRKVLQQYISGQIDYEKTKNLSLNIIGNFDAVDKIRDVLNVPKEPLNDYCESSENPKKRAHSWTPEEDKRLLHGITKFGLSNWADICKFIGNGRTRSQCSQRWHRSLNPRICKERWTPEDDEQLKKCVELYGDRAWTKVAQALGCRADVQCRYRYQLIMKKSKNCQERKAKANLVAHSVISKQPVLSNPIPKDNEAPKMSLEQFQNIFLTHGSSYQPEISVPKIQSNSIFSDFVENESASIQQPLAQDADKASFVFDEDNMWENIFGSSSYGLNEQTQNTTIGDSLILF